MRTSRLEAFSDGVLAIIITIMVLELKVPHEVSWSALRPLWPVFLSYVLSFVYLGIYWNNHHHMLHLTRRVTGGILWANLHLLFWLSLVPFTTSWMGENHFAPKPTAAYGIVLLLAAIAYYVLQQAIIRSQGPRSELAAAVGRDWKGRVSPIGYAVAILAALVQPWVAGVLYGVIALVWLVPDSRIERRYAEAGHEESSAPFERLQ
jgi:TMEM175 potassium channel family protein